jgi:hypothetical protein
MADTTEPKVDATAPTTESTTAEKTETSTAAAEKSASDAPAAVCSSFPRRASPILRALLVLPLGAKADLPRHRV